MEVFWWGKFRNIPGFKTLVITLDLSLFSVIFLGWGTLINSKVKMIQIYISDKVLFWNLCL